MTYQLQQKVEVLLPVNDGTQDFAWYPATVTSVRDSDWSVRQDHIRVYVNPAVKAAVYTQDLPLDRVRPLNP